MVSDERHPTLLAVTAHPDDESFLLAGTCARYAESGVRVVLVCATLGEVGRCGNPPVCRPEELGSVRLGELMAACREIGIETVELLGYRDGTLATIPDGEGALRILQLLVRYRPDVVLTFPPGGLSGHPDHKAVQRWSLRAVELMTEGAEREIRLCYATTPGYFELTGEALHHPDDAAANVRIAVRDWLPRKLAALRCHRSQHLSTEPFLAMLEEPDPAYRPLSDYEYFLQIRPAPQPGAAMAQDLFEPPALMGPAFQLNQSKK